MIHEGWQAHAVWAHYPLCEALPCRQGLVRAGRQLGNGRSSRASEACLEVVVGLQAKWTAVCSSAGGLLLRMMTSKREGKKKEWFHGRYGWGAAWSCDPRLPAPPLAACFARARAGCRLAVALLLVPMAACHTPVEVPTWRCLCPVCVASLQVIRQEAAFGHAFQEHCTAVPAWNQQSPTRHVSHTTAVRHMSLPTPRAATSNYA